MGIEPATFALQDDAQPTEPHLSGLKAYFRSSNSNLVDGGVVDKGAIRPLLSGPHVLGAFFASIARKLKVRSVVLRGKWLGLGAHLTPKLPSFNSPLLSYYLVVSIIRYFILSCIYLCTL